MMFGTQRVKSLALYSALVFVFTATAFAQPPRTRPDAGSQSGTATVPGAQATNGAWPRLRQSGQRGQGGQREVYSEALTRAYINPSLSPPSANWWLGVQPARAPKGIRLAAIVGNGPARRFGLESGDYILDIGGYVVGEYQGNYYPLSMAMDFGADPSGWAELLIWNKRTYAEETIWVKFRRR